MTLEEALDKIEVGQSIEQTLWTTNPGGDIEPEEGVEFQVQLRVVKEEDGKHSLHQGIVAKRNQASL